MKRRLFITAGLLATLLAGSFAVMELRKGSDKRSEDFSVTIDPGDLPATAPGRIVSLAPSITEVLFALGLGDRVVGVTRYCRFPPEVKSKKSVGGYYNPNYEAIVALKPDLVVLLTEHVEPEKYLRSLNIKVARLDHRNIERIFRSIETIGQICGVAKNAKKLTSNLKKRIDRIKKRTQGKERPRVLISMSRNMGLGSLAEIYVPGKETFYGDMLQYAGGQNAFQKGTKKFNTFGPEGILTLNPEIIIDMIPDLKKKNVEKKNVLREWNTLKSIDAVKNERVYLFDDEFVLIPGPRFIMVLEKMAKVIHPEIQWN